MIVRAREHGTGRYHHENKWERLCECGHTLGNHTGDRGKIDGVMHQPCIAGDSGGEETCACECFKLAKGARR